MCSEIYMYMYAGFYMIICTCMYMYMPYLAFGYFEITLIMWLFT